MNGLKAALYLSAIALMLGALRLVLTLNQVVEHQSQSMDGAVAQIQPKVGLTLDRTNRALLEIDFAAKAARKTSEASLSSVNQSTEVLRSATRTLTHLDSGIESLVTDTHTLSLGMKSTLDKTGYAVDAATLSLQKIGTAADSVQTLVSSPDIKMSFENLNHTTRNLSDMTSDGAAVTSFYRKQITHPAGLLKTVLKLLVPAATQGLVRR